MEEQKKKDELMKGFPAWHKNEQRKEKLALKLKQALSGFARWVHLKDQELFTWRMKFEKKKAGLVLIPENVFPRTLFEIMARATRRQLQLM